jgi:hypothetical protein
MTRTERFAPLQTAVDVQADAWAVLEESREAWHRRGPRSLRTVEGDPIGCAWCATVVDVSDATQLAITPPGAVRPGTTWRLCVRCARVLRLRAYQVGGDAA